MLASVVFEVQERILDKLELYMLIKVTGNQYGFKKKQGTDKCIFALKEIVASYKSLNSVSMFLMPLKHLIGSTMKSYLRKWLIGECSYT